MGWLEIVVPGAFMKGFWLSKYSRLTEVIIKPLHSTTSNNSFRIRWYCFA